MDGLVPWMLACLAPWIVQATVVSLLAWVALFIEKRWSPRARHAIVCVAFLSFAVPPFLNIPVLPSAGASVGALVASSSGPAGSVTVVPRATFLAGAALVWALGTLACTGAVLFQGIYLARVRRRAWATPSSTVRDCLASAMRRLNLERPPAVLFSNCVFGPCLTGLVRPAIVLNQSLAERLGPRALTLVLAHELAHLRQRDVWLNGFRAILCAVWWPHPLAWVLARESRRIREELCDDAVIAAFDEPPREYAETILDAAAALPRVSFSLVSVGAMGGNLAALGARLRRIADPNVARTARLSRLQIAGIAALSLAALNGPQVDIRTTREGETTVSFEHGYGHRSSHAQRHSANHGAPGRH